tara:strand:- start:120 stop:1175 length:1056 start_codon:yes stop_codon:yes gene_type:complete
MTKLIDAHLLHPPTSQLIPIAKRNKELQYNITNSCNLPRQSLNITVNGECYIDNCELYLPFSVCNILDVESLEEIWDQPLAKELQQDVDDKKFTYCAVEHCGIMDRDLEHSDEQGLFQSIFVNVDDSCNLACPSCRTGMLLRLQGERFDKQVLYAKHTIKLIERYKGRTNVTLTGNGDPLASIIMRPFVKDWIPQANHSVTLFTNGLLMKKQLAGSKILPNIGEFKISIDAGCKEVYEDVRRPGVWEKLIENLDWMQENKLPNMRIAFNFTAQKANALDIINFVRLCAKYNARGFITKLDDWKTFVDYEEEDITDNLTHPLREEFLAQLRAIDLEPNAHNISVSHNIAKYK